jgi:hypothetical protein
VCEGYCELSVVVLAGLPLRLRLRLRLSHRSVTHGHATAQSELRASARARRARGRGAGDPAGNFCLCGYDTILRTSNHLVLNSGIRDHCMITLLVQTMLNWVSKLAGSQIPEWPRGATAVFNFKFE